jgi:hypothetical protein
MLTPGAARSASPVRDSWLPRSCAWISVSDMYIEKLPFGGGLHQLLVSVEPDAIVLIGASIAKFNFEGL